MALMTGRFERFGITADRPATSGVTILQMYCTVVVAIDITRQGDEWTISTVFRLGRTKTIRFTLGQEFDDTTDDDLPCRSTITLDGDDQLVHVQRNRDGGIISTTVRKFTGTGMKMTKRDAQGTAMTIKYKRM